MGSPMRSLQTGVQPIDDLDSWPKKVASGNALNVAILGAVLSALEAWKGRT